MNYNYVMYPGSFDPVTNGHLDIINRLSKMYEKVFVVVAENRGKKHLFSSTERKAFIDKSLKKIKNVEVIIWEGLIVDCARKYNIGVIARGVRNSSDFNYEFDVSGLNKTLCPDIEYVFLPTGSDVSLIRSSYVKELVSFGSDVSSMVPKEVSKALIKAYKG